MTDDQMYKELQNFANEHALARDIIVTTNSVHTSYTAKDQVNGANYNDCVLLSRLVDGAVAYLLWKRRNNGRKDKMSKVRRRDTK